MASSVAGFAALALALLMALAGARAGMRWGGADRYRRGARVRGHGVRARTLRGSGGGWPPPITLAGVPLRDADEVRHFKLIGTTGTGKSTAIGELLRRALLRGDRAVISDPDGAYLRRFMRPYRGDTLLNPFDAGSARWALFGELARDSDVELLCEALIGPAADAAGQEWRLYARTFLA